MRIGDSHNDLVDELKNEFKNAGINETNTELSEWQQMLIDYLAGSTPWPKLPFVSGPPHFNAKYGTILEPFPKGKPCITAKSHPPSASPRPPEQ